MRFSGMCACSLVAWDCAEKAAGIQPQGLFAPDGIWVWWVVAFFWAFTAIRFFADMF